MKAELKDTVYDCAFDGNTELEIAAKLRLAWTLLNRLAETRLAKVGLTPEKLAVLWILRDYKDAVLSPAELGRLLCRESASLAGLLNRMGDENLVRRRRRQKGVRPVTELELTEAGLGTLLVGLPVAREILQSAGLKISLLTMLEDVVRSCARELHLEIVGKRFV